MRSDDVRNALVRFGAVDTLVIHWAGELVLDGEWSGERVKRASMSTNGLSLNALRQRVSIRRWVARVVAEGEYDVIVARNIGLALFLPIRAWSRLILDADDARKVLAPGASGSFRMAIRNRIARVLTRLPKHTWVVHPLDLGRLGSGMRYSRLAHCITEPAADRARPTAVPYSILMVGHFHYEPNVDGARWFAEQVLPRLRAEFPRLELRVVGRHLPTLFELLGSAVHLKGFVDDLAAEYDRAALVIAPIRTGSGAQIKVIDALAHARPLVASAFAHSGYAGDLRHGEHLLVATEASEWVGQCRWVFQHPDEAAAMARRGATIVSELHSFERLAAHVGQTLREVVSGPGARPR